MIEVRLKEISELCRQGLHNQALREIELLADFWRNDGSVLLLEGRIYTELHRYTKAVSVFDQALCDLEGREDSAELRSELHREKKLAGFFRSRGTEKEAIDLGLLPENYTPDELAGLCQEMRERVHLQSAVALCRSMAVYPDFSLSGYYPDVYYRYYSYGIMISQILLVGTVIFLSLSLLELAIGSVHTLFSLVFSIVALLPVLYVNVYMFFARLTRKEACYTEVYDGFVRIVHRGRIFHFSRQGSENIQVYSDENDYSFVALIRYLPLVPNFSYIRATDELRKHKVTLPLYGIAEGPDFAGKIWAAERIKPLNMLGVRMGQLENFLLRLSPFGGRICGGFLVLLALFFYAFYMFPEIGLWFFLHLMAATDYNFFLVLPQSREFVLITNYHHLFVPWYMVLFFLFAGAVFFRYARFVAFRLVGVFFRVQPFAWLLSVSFLRMGLTLIVFLLTYSYYFYYEYSFVPALALTGLFYLVFIDTRYNAAEKQVIAEISSVWKALDMEKMLPVFGYRHFRLPALEPFPGYVRLFGSPPDIDVFYGKGFITIPRSFCKQSFRYLIISQGLVLRVREAKYGSVLYLGSDKLFIAMPPGELRTVLRYRGIDTVMFRDYSHWETYGWYYVALLLSFVFLMHPVINVVSTLLSWFTRLVYIWFLIRLWQGRRGVMTAVGICVFLVWNFCDLARETPERDFQPLVLGSLSEFVQMRHRLLFTTGEPFWEMGSELPPKLHIMDPAFTWEQYESFINSRMDYSYREVPPFVAYGTRSRGSLHTLSWHFFYKQNPFNGQRYGRAMIEFCRSKNMGVVYRGEDKYPRCGVEIDYSGRNVSFVLGELRSFFPEEEFIKRIPQTIMIHFLKEQPDSLELFPAVLQKESLYMFWYAYGKTLSLLSRLPAPVDNINSCVYAMIFNADYLQVSEQQSGESVSVTGSLLSEKAGIGVDSYVFNCFLREIEKREAYFQKSFRNDLFFSLFMVKMDPENYYLIPEKHRINPVFIKFLSGEEES